VLTYEEGLAVGHRAGREGLFPFGHGLGYTDWEYLGATATSPSSVRVRLRNAGAQRGREVVQLYASRRASAVARPERWLAGFAAVEADPGQEVEVDVDIGPRALAHWDTGAGAFAVEPGAFQLAAGRSSADLRCATELVVG
jgi:beta-glucosidase